MSSQAIYYHAGCPVCQAAENALVKALDPTRCSIEIVHLGEAKDRVAEAEAAGVKSVPAFVIDGQAFHVNFGASLDVLK